MGGGTPRAATAGLTRLDHPRRPCHSCAPSRHSCAPSRHSCASRNHHTPTSSNSCYTHDRTGVPNHASPPQRRRTLSAVNHALANADQNVTEVDTRLTGVDKSCQKLTPSTPTPTPDPSKTQQSRNRAHYPVNPASTPAVNPSGASRTTPNNPEQPRTTPNKPEQIRTNPNTAKPPDQIGKPSRSSRIRPIKTTPNKSSPRLRRNDGIANVPQSARAAIGVWPVTSSRSHWSMVSGEMSVRRARTARVSRPSVGDG